MSEKIVAFDMAYHDTLAEMARSPEFFREQQRKGRHVVVTSDLEPASFQPLALVRRQDIFNRSDIDSTPYPPGPRQELADYVGRTSPYGLSIGLDKDPTTEWYLDALGYPHRLYTHQIPKALEGGMEKFTPRELNGSARDLALLRHQVAGKAQACMVYIDDNSRFSNSDPSTPVIRVADSSCWFTAPGRVEILLDTLLASDKTSSEVFDQMWGGGTSHRNVDSWAGESRGVSIDGNDFVLSRLRSEGKVIHETLTWR